MAGLGHLAGCGALLLDGEGVRLPVSVDGEGNAACPGRLDGETVTAGLAAPAEVRTMPLETLETLGRFKSSWRAGAPS